MTQLTREELLELYNNLGDSRLVLDARIQDIRDKQHGILTRQTEVLDTIYLLDSAAGKQTCLCCLKQLDTDTRICPECGEEQ